MQAVSKGLNGAKGKEFRLPIKVFDFFSGCGGTCKGFLDAGMDIVFALDSDPDAAKTFKRNFRGTYFVADDIRNISCQTLQPLIDTCAGHPILFSGCAPCQPFTKQKTTRHPNDIRRMLLNEFQRFVEYYQVEFLFVENVPGLRKISEEAGPFRTFLHSLDNLGYQHKHKIITSQSYGVPQIRRRFVLIASRLGAMEFPEETHGPTRSFEYSKVSEWIYDLPPIAAGEKHPTIANHRAAALSPLNLARIKNISMGQDRSHWPDHLKLSCHKDHPGHSDVYGRMRWDRPATGLTTRCISLSNGRFGHPEQNRAISVREAACLQTFPIEFVFEGSLSSMSRQIGNAVPVRLAECFGRNFNQHLSQHADGIS